MNENKKLKLLPIEKKVLRRDIQKIIDDCKEITESINEKSEWEKTEDGDIPLYMTSSSIGIKLRTIPPILEDVKVWLYSHKNK